jgi:hypothetical protein
MTVGVSVVSCLSIGSGYVNSLNHPQRVHYTPLAHRDRICIFAVTHNPIAQPQQHPAATREISSPMGCTTSSEAEPLCANDFCPPQDSGNDDAKEHASVSTRTQCHIRRSASPEARSAQQPNPVTPSLDQSPQAYPLEVLPLSREPSFNPLTGPRGDESVFATFGAEDVQLKRFVLGQRGTSLRRESGSAVSMSRSRTDPQMLHAQPLSASLLSALESFHSPPSKSADRSTLRDAKVRSSVGEWLSTTFAGQESPLSHDHEEEITPDNDLITTMAP